MTAHVVMVINSIYSKISLVVIVLLLSGLANASEWAMYRGTNQRLGYVEDSIPPPFETLWNTKIEGEIHSLPVFINNSLYFGSTSGFFYSLNAIDGSLNWKIKTNSSIYSSPASGNGFIIVGSE